MNNMDKSKLPSSWRFTSRQPIRSGATCSAGRAKKLWGRAGGCWEGVVAMGVAASLLSFFCHPAKCSKPSGNGAFPSESRARS